jgi:hypothetical protein
MSDYTSPLAISRLLIDKGLVTHNQITKALEYQCRLPPGKYMSLTDILVTFDYISERELRTALGEAPVVEQDPIGHILIMEGLLTEEQLNEAMKIMATFQNKKYLGRVLMDLGYVNQFQIERAIASFQLMQGKKPVPPPPPPAQAPTVLPGASPAELSPMMRMPLGRILIAKGCLTPDELKDAIDYQSRLPRLAHRPIGEILVEMGYINRAQLEDALASQPRTEGSPIGQVLIKAGVIEEWQLSHALSLQYTPEHAHKRLGSLLIELGYAAREAIEAALENHYPHKSASTPAAPSPVSTPVSSAKSPPLQQPQPPVSIPSLSSAGSTPLPPLSSAPPAPPAPRSVPIGQVLLDKGYITQAQLDQALQHQNRLARDYKPLGDILVMMGSITQAQLQESLAAQPDFGHEPIGKILVKAGVIEEWQLAHALCLQFEPGEQRRNLGQVLADLGYASREAIEQAVIDYFRNR